MNKSAFNARLLMAADWIERVDDNPKFRRVVLWFIFFSAVFFGGVIIGILVR